MLVLLIHSLQSLFVYAKSKGRKSNLFNFQNSYRNKNMSDGAKNLFENLNSTLNKGTQQVDEDQITIERYLLIISKFQGEYFQRQ